jgi:hypothetical protein
MSIRRGGAEFKGQEVRGATRFAARKIEVPSGKSKSLIMSRISSTVCE